MDKNIGMYLCISFLDSTRPYHKLRLMKQLDYLTWCYVQIAKDHIPRYAVARMKLGNTMIHLQPCPLQAFMHGWKELIKAIYCLR